MSYHSSVKTLKAISLAVFISMFFQFLPNTAQAQSNFPHVAMKKIGGFFHHFVQAISASDNVSSGQSVGSGVSTLVDVQATEDPIAVAPAVQTPVAAPAPLAVATPEPSHPKVIESHFETTTDNSKILIAGTVNAGTDFIQLLWSFSDASGSLHTDLGTVTIVDGHFEKEILLQYGPGTYTVKSSVGISTSRGYAFYGDSNQVLGTVLNQDPIPASAKLPTAMIQSDNPEIVALAKSITAQAQNSYDQAHAIHDWVSKNISYDYSQITHVDGMKDYYQVVQTDNDDSSLVVLHQAKGICYGYANLTSALLRAIGIPAQSVDGPVLLTANDHWDDTLADKDKPNLHAWNEAFVDNRWIIMDTTWDNVYGEKYFDPSAKLFAKDHRKISAF
jgi:hypothetical protein